MKCIKRWYSKYFATTGLANAFSFLERDLILKRSLDIDKLGHLSTLILLFLLLLLFLVPFLFVLCSLQTLTFLTSVSCPNRMPIFNTLPKEILVSKYMLILNTIL